MIWNRDLGKSQCIVSSVQSVPSSRWSARNVQGFFHYGTHRGPQSCKTKSMFVINKSSLWQYQKTAVSRWAVPCFLVSKMSLAGIRFSTRNSSKQFRNKILNKKSVYRQQKKMLWSPLLSNPYSHWRQLLFTLWNTTEEKINILPQMPSLLHLNNGEESENH